MPPVYSQGGYQVKNIYIEVEVDGSTLIKYKLLILDPPREVSVRIPDEPLSYRVYDNRSEIPSYYSNYTISFYAVSSEVDVEVLSLGLTRKEGAKWIFSVDMPYSYKLILPPNTLILNISRSDFSVSVEPDGRLSLLLPKGEVSITYTFPPEIPETGPGGGGTPWNIVDIYPLIAAIVIGGVLLSIYLMHRGKALGEVDISQYEIDERDRMILDVLKSGPKTASEIMEATGIPKSPLYRRLSKLVEKGYIESVKVEGKNVYRLRDTGS